MKLTNSPPSLPLLENPQVSYDGEGLRDLVKGKEFKGVTQLA